MKLKLVRTNGKHRGHEVFPFYVEIPHHLGIGERIKLMNDMRIWCWEEWGSSTERDHYLFLHGSNGNGWCWLSNYNDRFYFDNDEKLSWFLLKWG